MRYFYLLPGRVRVPSLLAVSLEATAAPVADRAVVSIFFSFIFDAQIIEE